METNRMATFLTFAAVAGNVLFVLWIAFNAMNEGFNGTLFEKISGVGLIILLALNCFLILAKSKTRQYSE